MQRIQGNVKDALSHLWVSHDKISIALVNNRTGKSALGIDSECIHRYFEGVNMKALSEMITDF